MELLNSFKVSAVLKNGTRPVLASVFNVSGSGQLELDLTNCGANFSRFSSIPDTQMRFMLMLLFPHVSLLEVLNQSMPHTF